MCCMVVQLIVRSTVMDIMPGFKRQTFPAVSSSFILYVAMCPLAEKNGSADCLEVISE